MRSRTSSGLPWVFLALLSGIALLVVVVLDLQRAVRNRGIDASEADQRALQAGAREVRRSLLDPELLDSLPTEQLFEWTVRGDRGAPQWGVPKDVGWITPVPIEPLPVLVQTLLGQAQAMEASLAHGQNAELGPFERESLKAIWERALLDPALDARQNQTVRLMAAWQAHRLGLQEASSAWLESLVLPLDPKSRASHFLLQSMRSGTLPADTFEVFGHLDVAQAQALAERLDTLGLSAPGAVGWSQSQAERRAVLSSLHSSDPPQSGESPSFRVLGSGELAVLFPRLQRGAWMTHAGLVEHASKWTEAQVVPLSEELSDRAHMEELVPEMARLVLPGSTGRGLFQGAVGWAFLIVGLAALCGGAAWLALRAARREAQAARMRGEFLTTVTHELKTPLAGIRLVSELLADGHIQEEPKRRKYLGALSAESTRLSMLIENVLDLRRMERGERVHDAQEESLTDLVRDTVELFEPLLEKGGHVVDWQVAEVDIQVLVDRDDFRQAFLNLLDNARKYGAGGIIRIGLSVRGQSALLTVGDTGAGIPTNERERIFERFTRGHAHQDGGIPGVGIGLNLARAIMRRQNGDLVAVEPPGGVGACFELTLPLTPASLGGVKRTSQKGHSPGTA